MVYQYIVVTVCRYAYCAVNVHSENYRLPRFINTCAQSLIKLFDCAIHTAHEHLSDDTQHAMEQLQSNQMGRASEQTL